MARIAGVDLPRNKKGFVGLTYIYGIGHTSAWQILNQAQVDPHIRVQDWTDDQLTAIRDVIGENYKTEGDLRGEERADVKRLMDIGCFRGLRHRKGLPLRGQKTQKNARTRKGKRKTVAGKKK